MLLPEFEDQVNTMYVSADMFALDEQGSHQVFPVTWPRNPFPKHLHKMVLTVVLHSKGQATTVVFIARQSQPLQSSLKEQDERREFATWNKDSWSLVKENFLAERSSYLRSSETRNMCCMQTIVMIAFLLSQKKCKYSSFLIGPLGLSESFLQQALKTKPICNSFFYTIWCSGSCHIASLAYKHIQMIKFVSRVTQKLKVFPFKNVF